jgi:hypothetical protein
MLVYVETCSLLHKMELLVAVGNYCDRAQSRSENVKGFKVEKMDCLKLTSNVSNNLPLTSLRSFTRAHHS